MRKAMRLRSSRCVLYKRNILTCSLNASGFFSLMSERCCVRISLQGPVTDSDCAANWREAAHRCAAGGPRPWFLPFEDTCS
eukprot:13168356-Alexandrium_andersonii.AAC.1